MHRRAVTIVEQHVPNINKVPALLFLNATLEVYPTHTLHPLFFLLKPFTLVGLPAPLFLIARTVHPPLSLLPCASASCHHVCWCISASSEQRCAGISHGLDPQRSPTTPPVGRENASYEAPKSASFAPPNQSLGWSERTLRDSGQELTSTPQGEAHVMLTALGTPSDGAGSTTSPFQTWLCRGEGPDGAGRGRAIRANQVTRRVRNMDGVRVGGCGVSLFGMKPARRVLILYRNPSPTADRRLRAIHLLIHASVAPT